MLAEYTIYFTNADGRETFITVVADSAVSALDHTSDFVRQRYLRITKHHLPVHDTKRF